VLDFNLAGVLLFLVPGLCTYGSLYGLIGFRSPSITPAPPPANSIKAIIIVLLSSVGVHAVTAFVIIVIRESALKIGLEADVYRVVATIASKHGVTLWQTFHLAGGALVQGLTTALFVRQWLARQARLNTLPEWLFGWTTDFANFSDDHDKTLIALVLTDMDIEGATLAYGGIVRDLGVGSKGEISRLILDDCQRYFIRLDQPRATENAKSLSSFDHFYVDATHIRNVTFEIVQYPAPESDIS
jgi:hypothetical protein